VARKIISFEALLREPFRLFFPIGLLYGFIGVGHWLFYDLGLTQTVSRTFHSSMQIEGFLMCFGTGFLLTALPRFMNVKGLGPGEFLFFLGSLLMVPLLLALGLTPWAHLTLALLIGGIFYFMLTRFPHRQATPPINFVFIPIGLLHGFLGSALAFLAQIGLLKSDVGSVGEQMVFQGMFLSLIMGIGGFLAPRLMGHEPFDLLKIGREKSAQSPFTNPFSLLFLAAGVLLFITFFLELTEWKELALIIRALDVSLVLVVTTRMWKLPQNKDRYVYALWISLWMVVLGLWMAAIFPAYRIAVLHILFIGGFSLMTLAVGTRVVLSHSGFSELLETRMPVLLIVIMTFLTAVMARAGADLAPRTYFLHLAIASGVWLVGSIAWAIYIFPKLFFEPAGEERESCKKKRGSC